MADNIQVLNAASVTTWLRAVDQGNGTVVMGSVPMLPNGTAMIGAMSVASSIPVNLTVPNFASVLATAGVPAAVAVTTGPAALKSVNLYCNNTTIPIFLKIYNLTAGAVNSSVVPSFTIGVAPGAPRDMNLGDGAKFTTAISYWITGLITSTDTTAVAINDLNGIITFI